MKNPWLSANPFLSMWMSAANTMLGSARGHALNAVRRQQTEATRAVVQFWSGVPASPKSAKKRRARSR